MKQTTTINKMKMNHFLEGEGLEWVFMIDEYNILIGIQRTLIDAS
jgi:hypothetical protein